MTTVDTVVLIDKAVVGKAKRKFLYIEPRRFKVCGRTQEEHKEIMKTKKN